MTATVLERAMRPAISIRHDATVKDAVRLMAEARVGAVVVTAESGVAGIFSERDLMTKVVLHALDPAATPVTGVMTAPALTILPDAPAVEALVLMRERHIRHLPVVDQSGKLVGMLSMRHLLNDRIEALEGTVRTLEAYASYDGASG